VILMGEGDWRGEQEKRKHQAHQDHQEVSADVDRVARVVVDAGFRVHRVLGPGLLEDAGYRLDLIVEKAVIVEIKTVEALTRLHEAQIMTYLHFSDCRVGFLMNFNAVLFKNGVRRLVL